MSIENQFKKVELKEIFEEDKIEAEKRLFANFLYGARMGLNKTRLAIASELGEKASTIQGWEAGREILTFPTDGKLPAVAKAYGKELEELLQVYNVSMRARKIQNGYRISIRRGRPKS